jgi:hypothetical protein
VGSVSSFGRLDLTDNALIVDYTGASPLVAVTAQIESARNGGAWNGTGITTSAGDAAQFALGRAETSALLGLQPGQVGLFRGQLVDSTSIVILFTRYGDANLDRIVDIGDFSRLASGFGAAGGWLEGDFNGDAVVDVADFSLLAANFGFGLPAGLPRGAIPEPSGLGLAGAGTLLLFRRRRGATKRSCSRTLGGA